MAVSNGKNVTSKPPRTSLWCLIYAQVMQADGKTNRNILLQERKLEQPKAQKEMTNYASTQWTNEEISERLEQYGLPDDSSLSVLCVEVFGYIQNIAQHINHIPEMRDKLVESIRVHVDQEVGNELDHQLPQREWQRYTREEDKPSLPLSDQLGAYRILRTSPLTEVPFICCTDE